MPRGLLAVLLLTGVARGDGIEDRTYHSTLNDRDVTIKVYTPPGYAAGTARYPVVYNLHGAGGGSPARQWDRVRKTLTGAMELKAVRPMIYVFVDGLGDTFFLDYATGKPKVESMIVRELVPWVDQNYRTVAGKHGRAVDGFSMGGYGCLMLAFRHPDLFCAVVSYGAALIEPGADLPAGLVPAAPKKDAANPDAPDPKKAPDQYPRAGRWGDKAHAHKYNPRALVKTNAEAIRSGLKVRVVCGDADKLYPLNVSFKQQLDGLKIPVDWVSVPGVAHDTKGLYDRVGVESLKFIERAFDAATPHDPPRLRASADGHSLETVDGQPFFWLGDTSWAMIEKGRRDDAADQPSVLKYFADRRAKGFNVLQVRLVPKAGKGADAYGHRPFADDNYARPLVIDGPDNDYWDWLDWFVDRAAEHGMYLAVLPCWLSGLPVDHPMTKDPSIGYKFGHFLGTRYGNRSHLIWVHGGDPKPDKDVDQPGRLPAVRAMAEGVADGASGVNEFDGQADWGVVFSTYHPRGGGRSSSQHLHAEPWVQMNMIQTTTRFAFANYKTVAADFARTPAKPTLDSEVAYEGSLSLSKQEPQDKRTGAWEARKAAYWGVFAGGCGHRSFIGFVRKGETAGFGAHVPWYEALDAPGAGQMTHLKRLMEAHPLAGRKPAPEAVSEQPADPLHHQPATRFADGTVMVYTPVGRSITLAADGKAEWFDPRTGAVTPAGSGRTFTPPDLGDGNDWVLVLSSPTR